jgi:hypothetical protein
MTMQKAANEFVVTEGDAHLTILGMDIVIHRSPDDGALVIDIDTANVESGDRIEPRGVPVLRVWVNEMLVHNPEDDGWVPPSQDDAFDGGHLVDADKEKG